jgi:hypothetical protein
VNVIEIRDEIVNIKLVIYYFSHLLIVPLLVVNISILDNLVADLLKNS